MSMKEVLESAEQATVLAESNGIKVMNFRDQNACQQADLIEGVVDPGVRSMNPDGTVARSYTKYAGVNVDSLFENRYRYIEESDEEGKTTKKVQVIVDYRACKEQKTGRCYVKSLPAYVVSRGFQKKLRIERVDSILDEVFVREFTKKLDRDAMTEILPLIHDRVTDVSMDKLSI